MTNEPYNQVACQAVSPHKSQVTLHSPTPAPTPSLPAPSTTNPLPQKVAGNFPWSVFNTAHKRCNSNDAISILERFTWELHATLLGNHSARRQRTPNRRDLNPRRRLKARWCPRPEQTATPPPEATPERGRCTRYGTMHPIRGTTPDQKRCIAYGSGAVPQDTRTNAELPNRATPRHNQPEHRTPGGHWAGVGRLCYTLDPHGARTHKIAPASSHGDGGRGRGQLGERARAYSLTAPAVRPDTMYFCRYWNSRTTGMAAITEPAAKMPHGAVRESAAHMYMPTASVNWL